jgi:hypothetical protein
MIEVLGYAKFSFPDLVPHSYLPICPLLSFDIAPTPGFSVSVLLSLDFEPWGLWDQMEDSFRGIWDVHYETSGEQQEEQQVHTKDLKGPTLV